MLGKRNAKVINDRFDNFESSCYGFDRLVSFATYELLMNVS